MNWESIINAVIIALAPIVLELLTGVLRRWAENLKLSTNGKLLQQAAGIVADAVVLVESTLKADLLKAKADGRITKEEGAALIAHASQVAMGELSKLPPALLAAAIPELESWVRRQIEVQLAKLKILQQVGPSSLPTPGVPAAAPSQVR